jgi:ankyrin repeat protein
MRQPSPNIGFRPRLLPLLLALLVLPGGCADLHESVRTGDLTMARFLLEQGAEVDETDPAGTTPLMVAARRGDGRLVTLLLDRGADIDRRNRADQSALSLAWEHGRELTFRLLLDRGAAIHFDAAVDRLPPMDRRRRLWRMAAEERLFRQIAETGPDTPADRFDAYFEQFPDGRRRPNVIEFLSQAARRDLAALGDSPDAAADFVREYGALGHRRFSVTASRLNIRADATVNARVVGQYGRGDTVRARDARPGWLRTDRGWISRRHVRPARDPLPELTEMLQTARETAAGRKAATGRSTAASRRRATSPASVRSQSAAPASPSEGPTSAAAAESDVQTPLETATPADRRRAEAQLSAIMATPRLKGLEAFILAYKDRAPYTDLVRRARAAYRELLLREVAP